MANYIVTPLAIAKQGLINLEASLVFAKLMHRDYSTEYHGIGDTVRIRRPPVLEADLFTGSLEGEYQRLEQSYVDVELDKHITVATEITSKELALDPYQWNTDVIEPMARAIAQKVDYYASMLYKDIPYYEATESTTALSDLANVWKVMENNYVPSVGRRFGVLCPTTAASFLSIDTIHEVDKAGTNKALRNAEIGNLFGFQLFNSQQIQMHTVGTTDVAGEIDLSAGYAAGAETIHIDGLAASDTIYEGTAMTVDGIQYVTTADTILSSNEGDFTLDRGLDEAIDDGDTVAINPSGYENMFFHEKAIALVSAPMASPIAGAQGTFLNWNGLNLNVSYGYDFNTKKNLLSMDFLCGMKVLYPEMCCRLTDAG